MKVPYQPIIICALLSDTISDQALRQIYRRTIQYLATLASAATIIAAITLLLWMLQWTCSMLVLAIHGVAAVFNAIGDLLGTHLIGTAAAWIFLTLIIVKFAFFLFPGLPLYIERLTEKGPVV